MPSIRTYYEILGVPYDADESSLRRAYRRAMQTVHPDLNADGKRTARRARHLTAAKETLLDAEKRKRYDAKLRRRGLIPRIFPKKQIRISQPLRKLKTPPKRLQPTKRTKAFNLLLNPDDHQEPALAAILTTVDR